MMTTNTITFPYNPFADTKIMSRYKDEPTRKKYSTLLLSKEERVNKSVLYIELMAKAERFALQFIAEAQISCKLL